jgi:acetyl esterase
MLRCPVMRLSLAVLLLTSAACAAGLQSDIEYGKAGDVSLNMDAWIPAGKGPFPTVILVHGGGWNHGDKADNFRWVFEPVSKAGFAWFCVNYRLAPNFLYAAAIGGVVQAVKISRPADTVGELCARTGRA